MPMTPATTGPEWMPITSCILCACKHAYCSVPCIQEVLLATKSPIRFEILNLLLSNTLFAACMYAASHAILRFSVTLYARSPDPFSLEIEGVGE